MAIGNAITKIEFFNTWSVDEIILLDVGRKLANREIFLKVIDNLSKRSFVPLTIGGWINTTEDIEQLLHMGADKVSINTKAYEDKNFITKSANKFGSQCIVVSIDARKTNNDYEVFIDRGTQATGITATAWAIEAERRGAGEILLTSIDYDGSRRGYDLELMKKVSEAVDIPVIAFGGVWNWSHLLDGINIGGVEAVAVGNVFHFIEHSTKKAKEFLIEHKVDMRESPFFNLSSNRNPKYEEVL